MIKTTYVYSCDRCGKTVAEKVNLVRVTLFSTITDRIDLDVCKSCENEVHNFFKK